VRQWNKEMKEWKYVSTVKEKYNTERNEVKKVKDTNEEEGNKYKIKRETK
jgi:hypothetical protein